MKQARTPTPTYYRSPHINNFLLAHFRFMTPSHTIVVEAHS